MSENSLNKAVERAVRRSTGASGIKDFDVVQPVWGGNGEVLRIELLGAPVESIIVKRITAPGGLKKKKRKNKDASLARTLTSYENELTFYQKYSELLGPHVRTARFYGGQRLEDGWVFVLEDLLKSGYSPARRTYLPQDIQGALKWLAGFHATFMGSSGEQLWKAGSYWNLADRASEQAQMSHPKLKQAAQSFDAALNNCRHKTLIHGDAKTDNFCFPDAEKDEVAGLDFQYVGLGCGMKDVMCLLDSCLDAFEAAVAGASYLDFYFLELTRAMSRQDEPLDVKEIEEEWRTLYPVAWADYYRFLDGWAPGKYPPQGYTDEMLNQALAHLARR